MVLTMAESVASRKQSFSRVKLILSYLRVSMN